MSTHIPFSYHQNVPNESDQINSTSINDILYQIRAKVEQEGPKTLIGEVANNIENHFKCCDITYVITSMYGRTLAVFSCIDKDIYANVGQYSSYEAIIEKMYETNEANQETAEKMLKNLSSGIDYGLFKGLGQYASKLMALLICETIRFHDDGFLARVALQDVINNNGNFYEVFLGGNSIASIFAQKNGKSRMEDQILGKKSVYNDNFIQDANILNSRADYFLSIGKENLPNVGNLQTQKQNKYKLTPPKDLPKQSINRSREVNPLEFQNTDN